MDPKIFAIWKPKGPSSNSVMNIIRRAVGTKHVGHAGTLDPLAEGILVVGVGREATKRLATEVGKEKEYEAEVTLGATSVTGDAEGPISATSGYEIPGDKEIRGAIAKFVGEIEQLPPVYSALKVHGVPAYRLTRRGDAPKLEARRVVIKSIELLSYTWPTMNIRVTTGPGVYIRSLASDLGQALSTGGYLSHLTRTRVGEWTKDRTISIEKPFLVDRGDN